MKNNQSFESSNNNFNCSKDKLIAKPVTTNPPMLEQPVTPPAYMWDRIEKILDQQDQQRLKEKELVKEPKQSKPKQKILFYAAFCVTVLAGLIIKNF